MLHLTSDDLDHAVIVTAPLIHVYDFLFRSCVTGLHVLQIVQCTSSQNNFEHPPKVNSRK